MKGLLDWMLIFIAALAGWYSASTNLLSSTAADIGVDPTGLFYLFASAVFVPLATTVGLYLLLFLRSNFLLPAFSKDHLPGIWIYALVSPNRGETREVVGIFRIREQNGLRVPEGEAYIQKDGEWRLRGRWTANNVNFDGTKVHFLFTMEKFALFDNDRDEIVRGFMVCDKRSSRGVDSSYGFLGNFFDIDSRQGVSGPCYFEKAGNFKRWDRVRRSMVSQAEDFLEKAKGH